MISAARWPWVMLSGPEKERMKSKPCSAMFELVMTTGMSSWNALRTAGMTASPFVGQMIMASTPCWIRSSICAICRATSPPASSTTTSTFSFASAAAMKACS